MESEKILIQGPVVVKRKRFWTERVALISSTRGFVWGRTKDSLAPGNKDSKSIPLQDIKMRRGKRLNGTAYLALCKQVKGSAEILAIRINFPKEDLETWANCFFQLMNPEEV